MHCNVVVFVGRLPRGQNNSIVQCAVRLYRNPRGYIYISPSSSTCLGAYIIGQQQKDGWKGAHNVCY